VLAERSRTAVPALQIEPRSRERGEEKRQPHGTNDGEQLSKFA
jgi:hypothetical protein